MPSPHAPVVINGRFLTHTPTGVQRWAREITRRLADRLRVVIVAPPGDLIEPDLGAPILRVGRLRGHAWEQVSLPRFLRSIGSPLLIGLANTGPTFYRPQIASHLDITWVRHPESFAPSFRLLYGAIVPGLLRRSAHVLTCSDFSAGELVAHFGLPREKITVAHAAVAPGFRADGPRYDIGEPYLLAVSSPNRHKNFDALMAAFDGARLSTIRRLLIVGHQARAFQSRTEEESERVEFLGRVDDDQLMALYRGAAAFAFPSLYEGFGIPPLEAQRMGTPVLAARAASLPEVLGDSALWVDPTDVADIRRGIENLDADPNLRARLSLAGRENEKRFSWDTAAHRVSDVIDDVRRSLGTP
ncbi:glycosyltransferase family 4 protein [Microbacterium sp. SLBN-111]|uniref:glycosyltransferase family 4 protein n=1 Tax=Microbacterium sp. SLBN-111 TaxID=3377733 RepID=UPI003C77E14D